MRGSVPAMAGCVLLAVALLPTVDAYPTTFVSKHGATSCFYSQGMMGKTPKIMDATPAMVTDCSSGCCLTGDVLAAGYEAGKTYTLTVTSSGMSIAGVSAGTVADADCNTKGKKDASTIKWTAPASGAVEVGATCASGKTQVTAFTATISEKAAADTTAAADTSAPAGPTTTVTTVTVTTTTVTQATGASGFNVAAECAKSTTVTAAIPASYNMAFCASFDEAAQEYTFYMSVGAGSKWGAVGLNAGGYAMPGTKFMGLTYDGTKPVIQYMETQGKGGVQAVAGQPPSQECTNDATQGLVCKWKRVADADWPADTSALTAIAATESGTPFANKISYHGTTKKDLGKYEFADSSATTPAPTTQATGTSSFNVAEECAKNTTLTAGISASYNMAFCSSFDKAAQEYTFYMSVGQGSKWGAVGLNPGGLTMPGTRFMGLTYDGTKPVIQYMETQGKGGVQAVKCQPPSQECINDATQGLVCKWKRVADADWPADTSALTAIVATESGTPFANKISYHGSMKGSAENIAAAADKEGPAYSGNLAHGALMILAWLVFSPIGTSLARYGKHIGKSEMLGGPVWFVTHRGIQIAAVLVTIIAAIIIAKTDGNTFARLTEIPDTVTGSAAHAKMGVAVCALAGFQFLLGMLRGVIGGEHTSEFPHGPNRWIFNWLHRITGWVLFGLAIATVYAGVTVFYARDKDGKVVSDDPVPRDSDTGAYLWLQDPAADLVMAFVFVSIGFGLIMELAHIPAWKVPWGPFAGTDSMGGEDGIVAKAEWEKTLRSVLLALYIAYCVATGIAMFVIIGDTETYGRADNVKDTAAAGASVTC